MCTGLDGRRWCPGSLCLPSTFIDHTAQGATLTGCELCSREGLCGGGDGEPTGCEGLCGGRDGEGNPRVVKGLCGGGDGAPTAFEGLCGGGDRQGSPQVVVEPLYKL